MNVKKIKHALNCCVTNECDICAYAEKMICFNTLLQDACTALEEQEERIAIMQESMEALEKRNEPQPPNYGTISVFNTHTGYKCPKCDTEIKFLQNFCSYCGQAVKWHE